MYYAQLAMHAVKARGYLKYYPVSDPRHRVYARVLRQAIADLSLTPTQMIFGV